jgi:hypothetical protein
LGVRASGQARYVTVVVCSCQTHRFEPQITRITPTFDHG